MLILAVICYMFLAAVLILAGIVSGVQMVLSVIEILDMLKKLFVGRGR